MAHWVKATSPQGKPLFINLDQMVNIMPDDDGGSLIFMAAMGTAVIPGDSKIAVRYLTTSCREAPDTLFSLPAIEMGKVQPPWQPAPALEATRPPKAAVKALAKPRRNAKAAAKAARNGALRGGAAA